MNSLSLLSKLAVSVPCIESPERTVSFKDKASWTFAFMLLLLALKNIPLVGFAGLEGHDIYYFVSRSVGSMPFGIFGLGCLPLMSAHTLLQIMIGCRRIGLDLGDKQQRAIFQGLRKLLAIILSFIMAFALISSGHYGNMQVTSLSFWFILLQLLVSQTVFILLDECVMRGFGLSSGINILITISVTETVFLSAVSPRLLSIHGQKEYEGALLLPLQQLFSRTGGLSGIWNCFTRYWGPNLVNVTGAVLAVMVVIWFQSYYFELSVTSARMRGWNGIYPIRILDNYSLPIYCLASATGNLYFWSYSIWKLLGTSVITFFTGIWVEVCNGQLRPTYGLAYVFAPSSVRLDIVALIPNIIYSSAVIYATVVISRSLGEVLGNSPKDIARQLKDQQLTIRGFRDSSLIQVLDRYVPPAASTGGLVLGIIVAISDLLGSVGSGCGLIITTMAIHSQVETFLREKERATQA